MSYLVVRIVPGSPVDGGTFGSYLDGLQIEVYSANAPSGTPPIGSTSIDQSNLMLVEVPWLSGVYVASVSKIVEQGTQQSGGNYGSSFEIEDGGGVAFNSTVVCPDNTSDISGNTYVTGIPAGSDPTVSLSQSLPAFIAAGTVVTFYFAYGYDGSPGINVDFSSASPSFSFQLNTNANANDSTTLNFANTAGVAPGMQVSGAGIPANVTVAAVPGSNAITLSSPVTVASTTSIQFSCSLNSGIVQHTEPLAISGFITFYIPIPVSVATAVIPIPTPPASSYLDITVVATRNGIQIPLPAAYYNVIVTNGASPTPDEYQAIALEQTAFYISLPPPPLSDTINLVIPTDGSAPTFDPLLNAMQSAIANDPYFSPAPDISMLSEDQCTRMAYDIVWSQQTYLPAPPDPLDSLYTNPPNPGGSASSNSSSGTNSLETDRQKFEGSLNSFYSTPNASAQRLTKFVAAASAAIFCEATSLNSPAALLEFPVDPSVGFAASVESELMIEGLGLSGAAGIHFGVPAAFFYALGATLDQSTTASQRFQIATGDTIERVLQLFTAAETASVIEDTESFYNSSAGAAISSFQAARRLNALGVSASSNCPSATVFSGTPLASLVNVWLNQTDPATDPPPNPPLTYENTDFNIWSQQIESSAPQGYLYLDLDALTQGYVIPAVTATASLAAASGNTLTFAGIATGIGSGMPVSGTNIAAGTVVNGFAAITTVTLNGPVNGGGVTTTDVLTFTAGNSTVKASPYQNAASGVTITFVATAGTASISAGMVVNGTGIAPNTLVASSQTVTTVTLSAALTGAVSVTDTITFNGDAAPFEAVTTVKCPQSGTTLTFSGSTGVSGIQSGMTVYGINIPSGTTVASVNTGASTVTISGAGAAGIIPANTVITFVSYPPPATLADEIFGWLPSTTNPPTANPVIATLKAVTVTQWTNFFTAVGNQTWLPPFTQPVPPGVSRLPGPQSAGYVSMRIRAFTRAVQLFFTVSSIPTVAQLPAPGSPPVFALPAFDPITTAAQTLPPVGSFTFGQAPIAASNLSTAVQFVFPGDTEAQAWLSDVLNTINELYQVALQKVGAQSAVPNPSIGSYSLPNPASLAASAVEALYARGFGSAADISRLSAGDFQQALTGTVAYDFASALYTNAQTIAPFTPSTGQTGGSFQPVNPDGTLINCIPPRCLSPTSPIAYLQELLNLSLSSTCADPWPSLAKGQKTLGETINGRRGPLGTLLASGANLHTPLPLIDIVNENLEFLASAVATSSGAGVSVSGTVYNTSPDKLAGFALCKEDQCGEKQHGCHAPNAIYAALPEYSTPATPVSANGSVEPTAFNALKQDFSTCCLPYSQALDVSRTYLRHFGSCRFEEMRTFRKCITEFALDPDNPPTGFQSFLWRYPVRIDTAIEYLGITPEEYSTVFQGATPLPCAEGQYNPPPGKTNEPSSDPTLAQGQVRASSSDLSAIAPASQTFFNAIPADTTDPDGPVTVAEFLEGTCLTYCEFLELWNSGFVQSTSPAQGEQAAGTFPRCEPCCLKDYTIQLPRGDARNRVLIQLVIVVRLWRKLNDLCNARYSFEQLYDIATVLGMFEGGALNLDFIRQLAAFQMLRDQFRLPLTDPGDRSHGGTGAARTHILALWAGPAARKWTWAVTRLLEGVEEFAKCQFDGKRKRGEFAAHLSGNLDALSRLAGFNPASSSGTENNTWNRTPGCTLRFAEVLAKMCASDFRVGELLYLFNAQPPHERENPFAQQDPNEALNYPLDVPESSHEHTLWKLREALLCVEVSDEEAHEWTWKKLVFEFRDKFGYALPAGQDPLLSLGQHFFPSVLEAAGFSVSGVQRQYQASLTSTTNWSLPPGSPFQYNASTSQLWIQLPLEDAAVASKLSQLPQLNAAEQTAVQDLYFAPRVNLGQLSFLFPDWQSAERQMIEEHDEGRRWSYFRRHFALAHKRRKAIAEHLARHVASFAGFRHDHLEHVADLVLGHMLSDENNGTPWESDAGTPPSVMWPLQPAGGAVAALLGLAGTGLLGEYLGAEVATQPIGNQQANEASGQQSSGAKGGADADGPVLWREVRAPMEAWGHEDDETSSPVPTVIPALDLTPPASLQVDFNNGYAVATSAGQRLGSAQAIDVRWTGVLLVDSEGEYAFRAGAPRPGEEEPDFERADRSAWRLTLNRGMKKWLVLNHNWPGEPDAENWNPHLRRGAYSIKIEYTQPAPDYSKPHLHRASRGFQVKYRGPDTDNRFSTLPARHLYRDFQDQTLDTGITFLSGSRNAQAFLAGYYTSTLRDMRRTYQRAFKAVLFAGGFALSARPTDEDGQSELGYFLANAAQYEGSAYYRNSGGTFTQHLADFDFDFLPLADNYHAPAPVAGDRSDPSPQRTQAIFDWWERIFDYCLIRRQVESHGHGPAWRLFYDAQVKAPADPRLLLGHLGADPAFSELDLRYFQDQSSPIYSLTDSDLQDDGWLVRVWRTEQWIRRLERDFHSEGLSKARPDLWASDDPSAVVNGATETGNANLLHFVNESCFTAEPRRYLDVKRLNDGLRLRGRDALIAYLCANDRVVLPWSSTAASAIDLSDLLLLDVRSSECEKASRIEEAITAVQNFIRRARLGLEPGWKVTREFCRLWDSRFETYHKWELCKRRELYRENWIEWEELEKARRIEAFRFLEDQLRSSTLTLAAPGGMDYWLDDDKSFEHAPELIQDRVPSELQPLTAPPQSQTREGLGTLGSPDYAAEPTWLTPLPAASASAGNAPIGSTSVSGSGAAAGSPASSSKGKRAVATAQKTARVQELAQAVATSAAQTEALPFWMESAMQMGTTFLRIAAAGIPEASLPIKPHHDDAKASCCRECGKHHPALVDEYYFWLVPSQFYTYTDQTDSQSNPDVSFSGSYQFGFQDSYYDQFEQQSAEWNEEDQVPPLLSKWQPNDGVRLAWCRVHNGQFQQPRKSEDFVAISVAPDLVFLGRGADSLYFEISGSTIPLPPGYGGTGADTSPPGFRFDLPTDEAVVLPQVAKPLAPDITYPGGLESYPFFAFDEPGARLFPSSWFSPSLLIAESLRGECKFEFALRWYKRSFDPLQNDCAWMVCAQRPANPNQPGGTSQPAQPSVSKIADEAYAIWEQHGRPANEQTEDWFEAQKDLAQVQARSTDTQSPVEGGGNTAMGACCDSTKISSEVMRNRAVTLHYCETLLEWADRLMHRRNSPEALQQARLLCDTAARVAGPRPLTVLMPEPLETQPVSSFTPAYAPLNPRLMDLYSILDDRLGLIHTDESARRLRLPERMDYFGDSPLREGWRTEHECCASEDCCNRPSPYRFTFQIQKAMELASRVHEFESALLSAYEKLDAEALASIHAEQEREMLALGISIRQDQWRDADWQIQALQQTKEASQADLIYYNNLYQAGLINDEIQNLSLANNAMQTRTAANIVEAFAESFRIVPDLFVGAMSTFSQIPIGTKLAGLFETIAKVMQTVAEIQSSTAAIDMTQSTWARRSIEWFHQMQVNPIHIQQSEMLILGAHRRRDQAMQELNNQQRQIEHAAEVLDFLRDKFTSTDLYLMLKKETAAMHARMYRLAHCASLEAQRAFNFERGDKTRHFLPEAGWENLRGALVAGERLQCALARMEKAYFDENTRERELTKHFSLRMHFPEKFLELKATGRCDIELPEPMFDVDYPGHYMRRIRSVSLTIPCVTGPYTGVHCRMTLLSSTTRIDPRVNPPSIGCCCECGARTDYEGCPHDPRFVHAYGAREAIATSNGQNDSGLFELNFHDERYLPFEFQGAVSRWRIELPFENNYFPIDTLTDLLVHLNYTAREGGEMLRRAAGKAAEGYLPGLGWAFFDVRYEFPDAWQLLENDGTDEHTRRRLSLHLHRRMFPYVPGVDQIVIDRIALVYDARQDRSPCGCAGECNCPRFARPAAHFIEFTHGESARRRGNDRLSCLATDEWPNLYYGILETQLGPIGRDERGPKVEFHFPEQTGPMERLFLLCRYCRWQRTC